MMTPTTTSPKAEPPGGPPHGRRWLRRGLTLLIIAGAGWYALSGIYTVEPDERAVVRLAGRIVDPPAAFVQTRSIRRRQRPIELNLTAGKNHVCKRD